MSSEYPDVLGDLVDARQRFEVNGVHYMLASPLARRRPSASGCKTAGMCPCR
jgi:hypothetical protein